jgi:uncharacterized DUF497 family protein
MLEFEWDEEKAAENKRKHGLSFEQATLAFRDLFSVEWRDAREEQEDRIILLGVGLGQIMNVVYTERGDRIRIISARRATKDEKDQYYHQNGQ